MRAMYFSQKIGMAVLVGLVLQKSQWGMRGHGYRYGVRGVGGMVVERAGTPLYVVPPGVGSAANDETDITAAITDSITSTTTSISQSVKSIISTASASASSHASTTPTSSSPTTDSSSSASSSPTTAPPPLPDAPAPRQPSSIRYLAPVFILILITLLGWLYSKYSARKHRRNLSTPSNKEDPFNPSDAEKHISSNPYKFGKNENDRGGWKEIPDDDVWYAGDDDAQWASVEGGGGPGQMGDGSGRREAVSVQGRGLPWGWKSTFNNWKSARGRGEREAELLDELGRPVSSTVKLVTTTTRTESFTYQTLPEVGYGLSEEVLDERGEGDEHERKEGDYSGGKGVMEERGSIRALRAKLVELTWGGGGDKSGGNVNGKLDRSKGVNKRPSVVQGVVPPEPPAWVIPASLPSNQVISPPLQPGLFFHHDAVGAGVGRSIHGVMEKEEDDGSASGSDYSEGEGGIGGMVSIPSTAEGLAGSYTDLPPRTPRSQRGDTREAKKTETVGRRSGIVTQAYTKSLKRNPTAPPSSVRVKSSTSTSTTPRPRPKSTVSPNDNAVASPLRRSMAIQDLSTASPPSSKQVKKRESTINKSTISQKTVGPVRPKSRIQRREEKAAVEVEDILKASWSDRAILASPPPVDLDGVGMVSPGVEEAAVLGGGGIEQRLEMIRRLEGGR